MGRRTRYDVDTSLVDVAVASHAAASVAHAAQQTEQDKQADHDDHRDSYLLVVVNPILCIVAYA